MQQHQLNPWTVTDKHIAYENAWLKVTHHDVLNSAGNKGVYGVVHFKHIAIGVVALDEHKNTWLVGQFRFPLNKYTWEIPEGGGKLDVDPLESAKRELLEETGIEANNWQLIQQLQLSNSATDEIAFLFLATDLTFLKPMPDEGELLDVKKIPFNEAYQMVQEGEIEDSLSVAAIQKVKLMMLEGLL